MFSVKQKRQIADAVQQILSETNHPELPVGEISFHLHVDGAKNWSWAVIENNGAVTNPGVNPWNESQADHPTPQPPIDGEVAELVEWLGDPIIVGAALATSASASRWITRATDLLQRQHPQPVPVSEQWPEFSDCDDAEHVWCWSWAIGTWRLSRINQSIHTHWLPANALPVPPSND